MTDTVDGKLLRDNLRVSIFDTVYHPTDGVLCQGNREYGCVVYQPIMFRSRAAAQRWIENGTIAELQESLSNLCIVFSRQTCAMR